MTNEECLHETLYFGSGDFYMICRKCQRYWRMEDHYTNNVGEACKLSGQDRVTARPEGGALVAAAALEEACIIALAISGHFCANPDEWLRGHEKRLRELEKHARLRMNSGSK